MFSHSSDGNLINNQRFSPCSVSAVSNTLSTVFQGYSKTNCFKCKSWPLTFEPVSLGHYDVSSVWLQTENVVWFQEPVKIYHDSILDLLVAYGRCFILYSVKKCPTRWLSVWHFYMQFLLMNHIKWVAVYS